MTSESTQTRPRVLLVGGSGIVGHEIARALVEQGISPSVLARTARSSVTHIGDLAAPTADLKHLFAQQDVIVNLVANTQWTMTDAEAIEANVDTAEAVGLLTPPHAHLVHVSTSFLGPRAAGETGPRDSFRNAYEYSKALSEHRILDTRPDTSIVRIPQILGNRANGKILRYDGFYSFIAALSFGLVPVIVGEPDAVIDIAPCDEAAALVAEAALSGATSHLEILSVGPDGPTVEEILARIRESLNDFRSARGLDVLPKLPIVPEERWDRLYWPLAKTTLSGLEQRAIDLVMEFSKYTGGYHGASPTRFVDEPRTHFLTCMSRWITDHERRASRPIKSWGLVS